MSGSPGAIVILNGAPRSGKSSIARAMQARLPDVWFNRGVDSEVAMLPAALRPGIGLRPGNDNPALKALVLDLYAALYGAVAAFAEQGFNVVMDVGHHDAEVLRASLRRLQGCVVMLVGVRCPLDQIMARRAMDTDSRHVPAGAPVPEAVLRWELHVHDPGIYDLEIDTALITSDEGADRIGTMLAAGLARPTAVERLLN